MVCTRRTLSVCVAACRRVGRMCPYVVCHLSRTNFTTIEIVSKSICPISLAGQFRCAFCAIFFRLVHSAVGFHNFHIRMQWVNFTVASSQRSCVSWLWLRCKRHTHTHDLNKCIDIYYAEAARLTDWAKEARRGAKFALIDPVPGGGSGRTYLKFDV